MDEQLKRDAHLLYEKIRQLTLELDKNIENISNEIPKENIKIEIKEKENKNADMEVPARGLSEESLAIATWPPTGMIKLDEVLLDEEDGFQGIVNVALLAPDLEKR